VNDRRGRQPIFGLQTALRALFGSLALNSGVIAHAIMADHGKEHLLDQESGDAESEPRRVEDLLARP
jgi:hypothetical protein